MRSVLRSAGRNMARPSAQLRVPGKALLRRSLLARISPEPLQHVTPDGERFINSTSGQPAEERLLKVRGALERGALGFGFSAGGFLYPYHLGILWRLHELNILRDYKVKMAGASAGSLAVATYNCGLDVEKATSALKSFAADCRAKGTRYRLGPLLKDFLHAYLPDDAHERCRGNTFVAVTRVFPYVKHELISEFDSKDDFVNALLTSCHIPFYFNGSWMTMFRGRYYMDGGVASFIPRPPTEHAVKVCCFPVNEVLSSVQGRVSQYERVASLLDIAISPDAFEAWPYDYQTMLTWALVPAEDDVLAYFIAKGRKDAHTWAQRMNLIPEEPAAAAAASSVQFSAGSSAASGSSLDGGATGDGSSDEAKAGKLMEAAPVTSTASRTGS